MIGRSTSASAASATSIVDKVDRGAGECDFVDDIAAELPLQVIAEIMGVPQEDRHKLFEWTNRMVGADDPEYNVRRRRGDRVADRDVHAYANELAERARANPRDDIVSKLLHAEVDGEQLSELEFDIFFLLLAVAGNETTRNAISHGMHALLDHPEQRAKLLRATDSLHRRRGRGDAALGVAGDALPAHGDRRHRARAARRSRPATRS